MVANRAEPHLPRGRVLPGGARRPRTRERRPLPASCRGEPGRVGARQGDARDDLALGDASLEASPRAARRGREARRGHRLHHPNGAPPRHPGRTARAVRDPDRLLRRRRADEPPRVRRNGHGLQPVPRRGPVGVRPRAVELGRRDREAARARCAARRGALLGRRSRVLRAAGGREGRRRVLLRLRRQVPTRLDEDDGGGGVPPCARPRLRPRRPRLPGRHGDGAHARRHPVQPLRTSDLGRAREPQHDASPACDRRGLVDGPPVRARVLGRRDRLEPARRDRALVRARSRARRRRERRGGGRRLPRARGGSGTGRGDGGRARERVLDEHTYAHRARRLLELVGLEAGVAA